MNTVNEVSLEPLSDKEANDILELQRKARIDLKGKKETYKVCKLQMRLSRDGWVSYNCEIRKGGSRGKTVAYVDQDGVGGSEHIYGYDGKEALQEIKDWIWDNCRPMFLQYETQCYLLKNNLQSVENNDPKLLDYLKPKLRAWKNKEQNEVTCDHLVGWWATLIAEEKYYSKHS